jgi:hypothetical protein
MNRPKLFFQILNRRGGARNKNIMIIIFSGGARNLDNRIHNSNNDSNSHNQNNDEEKQYK